MGASLGSEGGANLLNRGRTRGPSITVGEMAVACWPEQVVGFSLIFQQTGLVLDFFFFLNLWTFGEVVP